MGEGLSDEAFSEADMYVGEEVGMGEGMVMRGKVRRCAWGFVPT